MLLTGICIASEYTNKNACIIYEGMNIGRARILVRYSLAIHDSGTDTLAGSL